MLMRQGKTDTVDMIEEEDTMTKKVEDTIRKVLIRNLRAFANDADEYGMDADEQSTLYAIADRLETGTEDEADWMEAIAQIDING